MNQRNMDSSDSIPFMVQRLLCDLVCLVEDIDHLFISFFRKRIPASIACLRKKRGKEKR